MRPTGTAKQLEKRRRQALRVLKAGKNLPETARAVGASVSSVFRWYQAYRKHGLRGLKATPTPGRPPKLSPGERKALLELLLEGPTALGYRTDLWTLKRIAHVIYNEFDVRYHPCHVWRLLTQLGWSCQKPERRALQRDEKAIAHWKRRRWPYIKNGGKTWGPSGLPR